MSKIKAKSNKSKLRNVLLAILPGLVVFSLVWGANIYFDLDTGLGRIMTWDDQEFKNTVYLGALEFAENAGQVSWINLPVGTATSGTPMSYTAQIDSQNILTVYAEANGAGGIQYPRVGIGTTTPAYTLDLNGTFRVTGTSTLGIINAGTWQGTAIGAIYGGTGLTSYATGTILIATSTNTLYGLPIGSSSQVLTVVSGKPAWQVAAGIGGSGTLNYLAKFTATTTLGDSIVYATGTYVGISTTTPTYTLDVYGTLRAATTSLGTVTSGTWQGGIIATSYGGTGTSTAPTAGAVIYGAGTTYGISATGTTGYALRSGGTGAPTWGTLGTGAGGTGLTATGTANQLLGMNAAASALQYKTLSGTANRITVTHADGSIILSAPQDIATSSSPTFSGLTLSGLTANRLLATDDSSKATTTISSSNLRSSVTDPTGTGSLVFATSPSFLTSVITGSASFDVFNATATTLNFAGAATSLTIGATTGTTTIRTPTLDLSAASSTLNFSSATGAKQIQTGGTTHLALMPAGNVGIGTTTPTAILDVYASSTATALTVSQSGTGKIVDFSNATGSVFTIASSGNITVAGHILPATTTVYDLGSSTYKWRNLYAATTTIGGTIIIGSNTFEGTATTTLFTTGNANQLVLGANGNVGIGTTTPATKLHVYESALDKSGALINIATTSSSYYSLNVQSAGTSRLYVRADGNVGIGTTAPESALDVSGKLIVRGEWGGRSWKLNYDGAKEYIINFTVYNGKLYAAQGNTALAGDVFVFDGTSWSTSYDGSQEIIYGMAVYNGKLYVGQGLNTGDGDIFVFDGTSWSTSTDRNQEVIYSLAVYNGKLYAGQGNGTGDGDVLVCDPGGDGVCDQADWSTSYDGAAQRIHSLAVYNGKLYADQGTAVDGSTDGDVLVYDGTTWSTSFDGNEEIMHGLAVYNGKLYAGQSSAFTGTTGGDVYVFDGTTWSLSYDGSKPGIYNFAVYDGKLYAGEGAGPSGGGTGDILVFDGTTWSMIYDGGQETIYSLAVYNGKLYAGQGAGTGDGDIYVFEVNLGSQLTNLARKLEYLSWGSPGREEYDFNKLTLASNLFVTGKGISYFAGNVGIGTTPNEILTVEGRLSLKETTAPASTTDYGKLYVLSADSKLYFMDDSGTTYDLTAAGISGSGSAGQVTFWTDASTVSGDSNLFWDNTNKRLGIGTTTPAALLDVYASSTATALTVAQSGTGNIVEFKDAGITVFKIADGGNVTVAGHILPATTTTYDLGSLTYKWRNIYAATATIGETITINTNTISGSGTTTINTTAGSLILNPAGNVGIGTTTPAHKLTVAGKLAMNNFVWDPVSTSTELWLFDHEGQPVMVIDATSSPIIWSQNLSSEFSQGSFEHTTTTNDKVYLEKDESGNYYSNGSFMTNSHDYQGTVEFLEMRTVARRISASTTISAQVQVSDDNFSTIKDSITLELSPDLQMHGVSSLSNARYVRIKFDFQTQDSTLSPELIYFEVWTNLIEESVSTTASSENTSSDLTVKENGSGQIVQIDVKAELVNLGLIVNEYGVLEVETLKAKKVVTDEFELRDKATGEIYCTWIENGEWVKIKGECSRLTQMINEAEPQNDGSSTSINDTEPEPKAEATTTEATTTEATTTEATTTEATSTEPVCEPTDEICDGLDNDCDGQIDEDLTKQCGTSDIGACQFGTQTCQAGVWGECIGAVEPMEEICDDNIDNNCDGLIDEGCEIQASTSTDQTATSTNQ